jgi:hypothetical protein
VPGHRVRKPIVIALYDCPHQRTHPRFSVTHSLPSLDGRGYSLDGHGDTEEEAVASFLELLTGFHGDICDDPDEILSEEVKLQRDYLKTILVKED